MAKQRETVYQKRDVRWKVKEDWWSVQDGVRDIQKWGKSTNLAPSTPIRFLPLGDIDRTTKESTTDEGYRYLCRFVGSGRTLDVMYIMWISGYAMVIWYFAVLFKVLFVLLSLSMYWRLFPWFDVDSDTVMKNLIMFDNIHFTEVWSNVFNYWLPLLFVCLNYSFFVTYQDLLFNFKICVKRFYYFFLY